MSFKTRAYFYYHWFFVSHMKECFMVSISNHIYQIRRTKLLKRYVYFVLNMCQLNELHQLAV